MGEGIELHVNIKEKVVKKCLFLFLMNKLFNKTN